MNPWVLLLLCETKIYEEEKLCCIDTDSFIAYIKTDIYKDIAEDVETIFDPSNCELDHYLQEKIWWKRKIVLYGYTQFHCIHKNIFAKILQKILKLYLILQIMN